MIRKRSGFFAVLVLFCSVFFSLVQAENHAPKTLIIAYEDKAQFPYYLGDSQAIPERPGVAVEMVQALQEVLPDTRIELRRYPWKRCLVLLENGRVDAIFNASYTPAHSRFGQYPSIDDSPHDPEYRLTNISYHWYRDIDNDRAEPPTPSSDVAAPSGYSVTNLLKSLGYRPSMPESSYSALRMVTAGYVQAAALQTVTGDRLIQQKPELNQLVRVEPAITEKPYYLLFSKTFYDRYPELTEQLWQEIRRQREQRLPALLDTYLADNP